MGMGWAYQVWGIGDTFKSRHVEIWIKDSYLKGIWIWRLWEQIKETRGSVKHKLSKHNFRYLNIEGGDWGVIFCHWKKLDQCLRTSSDKMTETRRTLPWVCGSSLPGWEHEGPLDGWYGILKPHMPRVRSSGILLEQQFCYHRSLVLAGMSLGQSLLATWSSSLRLPKAMQSGATAFSVFQFPCKREGSFQADLFAADSRKTAHWLFAAELQENSSDFLNQDNNLLKPEKKKKKAVPLFTEYTF